MAPNVVLHHDMIRGKIWCQKQFFYSRICNNGLKLAWINAIRNI